MSEQRADYQTDQRQPFDVTQAEMNLILRLRQHRGMIIVDWDAQQVWPANHAEQCNGRKAKLPFDMQPA